MTPVVIPQSTQTNTGPSRPALRIDQCHLCPERYRTGSGNGQAGLAGQAVPSINSLQPLKEAKDIKCDCIEATVHKVGKLRSLADTGVKGSVMSYDMLRGSGLVIRPCK